ncbi:MAG: aminotransferase class I/II-fold pyridoxal phosphate-dependent enzyme [Oscillospiraceae bacterium]|nr:aminotransferase class I/II-fold pyridoxal phosphate-dependent enzyme [Oscillospiraceae bacterium]
MELTKKIRSLDLYIPPDSTCRIRLDSNESPYDMIELCGEDVMRAVADASANRYPDPQYNKLINAAAEYFDISPDLITAGNGSDELISVILGTFLAKGDMVLTVSPDFSMYAFYGFLNELKVQTLPKEDDLKINISKVIEYCSANPVKAVIFSNPCNPTSLGVRRQDVVRLVKNVSCLCVIDEAYMDFWDQSVIDQVEQLDNLIVLKTASKNMGMAGLRLGFAFACRDITDHLRAVKSPYNISTLTCAAACAIMRRKDLIDECTARITESRNVLRQGILDLSDRYFTIERVYDSVTNFVYIRTQKAAEIAKGLTAHDISVRQLGVYLRITAGTPEETDEFLRALEEVLSII